MKKAILITFFYPPLIGPGGVRPSKLKKFLPNFGWDIDVLTVGADHFPEEKDPQVFRVPCNAFLFKKKLLLVSVSEKKQQMEQSSRVSFRSRLLHRIGWSGFCAFHYPDLEEGWVDNAYKKGCRLLQSHKYNTIISSFPPVAAHRLASKLSKRFGVPWVADYRDEWSTERYFSPRKGFWKLLDRWVEKGTLKNAAHIITVSEPIAEALGKLHKKSVAVVPNGFDPDDFPDTGVAQQSTKFCMTFTGHLSPKNNLDSMLLALSMLRDVGIINAENFSLKFVGAQRATLMAECQQLNIESLVECTGWVSYEESLRIQKKSEVLFYPYWDSEGADGVFSSKIFTYIGADSPVLFIGPKAHIIASVLHRTGLGETATTVDECVQIIQRWVEEWRQTGDIKMNRNEEEIQKYSRKYQAGQFADILNSVVMMGK